MKNVTTKQFSLLGLVLIAASAVTAAVLPKKANIKGDDDNLARQGRLVISSAGAAGDNTCIAENNPALQDCHYTATENVVGGEGSGTSNVGTNFAFTSNTATPNNVTGTETTLVDDND